MKLRNIFQNIEEKENKTKYEEKNSQTITSKVLASAFPEFKAENDVNTEVK